MAVSLTLPACPRCTGRHVRVEHVIQAGRSYRAYLCAACSHAWRVLETGEHVPTIDPDRSEQPDRSR